MEKRSAYYSASGLSTTVNSVVAYLDVLGFAEEMQTAHRKGTSDDLLRKFANVVNEWIESTRECGVWELKAFTDNLVIGYPINGEGEGELGSVLSEVGSLQLRFALKGFFIRGGIAIGELYMDNNIVYGVGLVDAYTAEQSADVPRILLSDSAVEFLKRHLMYYGSVEISPQNDEVLVDEDTKLFINYLDSVRPDYEAPQYQWLSQHRNILTEKLDLYRKQPQIWAKYAWLARSHNYFCDIFPEGKKDKIEATLLNLRARRLAEVYSVPYTLKRLT